MNHQVGGNTKNEKDLYSEGKQQNCGSDERRLSLEGRLAVRTSPHIVPSLFGTIDLCLRAEGHKRCRLRQKPFFHIRV